MLSQLGFINDDKKISITNVVVFVFVLITAFKELFSGLSLDLGFIQWKIEALDISSTLPLLFSLLNYGHKRITLTKDKK